MLSAPETAASAFAAAGEEFGEFDIRLIEAAERSGRLTEVFRELAEYYGTRFRARRDFISQMIYPLVVLNLGAVLVAVPVAIQEGLPAFLGIVIRNLAVFYGLTGLLLFIRSLLRRLGQKVSGADFLIRHIPWIGRFYADAADGRFCFGLQLQVRSGISIYRALDAAAAGSGSAYLRKISHQASKRIQQGSRLWEAFANAKIHPLMQKAFRVGEESGRLDEQLQRCAFLLQEKTARRTAAFAEWAPKILYFVILLILASQIIMGFQKSLASMNQLFELE